MTMFYSFLFSIPFFITKEGAPYSVGDINLILFIHVYYSMIYCEVRARCSSSNKIQTLTCARTHAQDLNPRRAMTAKRDDRFCCCERNKIIVQHKHLVDNNNSVLLCVSCDNAIVNRRDAAASSSTSQAARNHKNKGKYSR